MAMTDSTPTPDTKDAIHKENMKDIISKDNTGNVVTVENIALEKSLKDPIAVIDAVVGQHVSFTLAEEKAVLRKIDLHILPIILFAYFLQQLDKSALAYSSVFDLQSAAGLHGQQYSWLGSILYLAQLVMQPLGALLLVKLPTGKLIAAAIFCWGVTLCGMAACHSFGSLLATRFLLGTFESLIAPSLIAVTQIWWRRSEQTNRIAAWTGMNGLTPIFGSLATFGLGHIKSPLHSYQIIFLFCGCLTLAFSVIAFILMPDSPIEAKFWGEKEEAIAVERLRANQMGIISRKWEWGHVKEAVLDLKTWCWFIVITAISIPSGGIGTFGPLIIQNFGFDKFKTILFNIPFGAVQCVSIFGGGYLATRWKRKGVVIALLCVPSMIGNIILLSLPHNSAHKGVLLFGYYMVSFYPGITPLIFSWSSQNTAGDTKRKVTTGIMFVGLCAGNVAGPQLYISTEKPVYSTGLISNLAMFCLIIILCGLITLYLMFLNKRHASRREALGKSGHRVDESMLSKKEIKLAEKIAIDSNTAQLDNRAFLDATDVQNEDFIYVY